MRRITLSCVLALLALGGTAQAQQQCNGCGIGYWYAGLPLTGGTLTGPLLLPDGTAAAPSLAPASDPDTGIFFTTDTIRFSTGGSSRGYWTAGVFTILSDSAKLTFGAAADTTWSRPAAAVWQAGAADAAAPVAQTLQAQGVAAGTSDTAGASYMIRPGIGRGLAVPGVLTLNRSLVTTTGNSAQAQQSAFVPCGTKTMSTTSAQAQAVATITTTTTSGGSALMYYTVTASDGTNVDTDSGEVSVSWNNLAATVAANMSAISAASNSVVAPDTLAATPTVTVATDVVSIKLTPTWANTVPTLVTAYFTFQNNSVNAIACQ